MIGYLDTSAFVPLLVAEPSSAACRRFWNDADDVVVCRILYVETAAALAKAERLRRIGPDEHVRAAVELDNLWAEVDIVDLDEELARSAAGIARALGLRGYDAVHCAAAAAVVDADLVAAAGDRALLRAWRASGVATYDTSDP